MILFMLGSTVWSLSNGGLFHPTIWIGLSYASVCAIGCLVNWRYANKYYSGEVRVQPVWPVTLEHIILLLANIPVLYATFSLSHGINM